MDGAVAKARRARNVNGRDKSTLPVADFGFLDEFGLPWATIMLAWTLVHISGGAFAAVHFTSSCESHHVESREKRIATGRRHQQRRRRNADGRARTRCQRAVCRGQQRGGPGNPFGRRLASMREAIFRAVTE